jgi:hypothetical protein
VPASRSAPAAVSPQATFDDVLVCTPNRSPVVCLSADTDNQHVQTRAKAVNNQELTGDQLDQKCDSAGTVTATCPFTVRSLDTKYKGDQIDQLYNFHNALWYIDLDEDLYQSSGKTGVDFVQVGTLSGGFKLVSVLGSDQAGTPFFLCTEGQNVDAGLCSSAPSADLTWKTES